jgi:hypothetical protein
VTAKFLKSKRTVRKVRAENSPSSSSGRRASGPAGFPGHARATGARNKSRVSAAGK